MINYKQYYIDSIKEERFEGWAAVGLITFFIILIWFFGMYDVGWTIDIKIVVSIILLVFIYSFGISRIIKVNAELKSLRKNDKYRKRFKRNQNQVK